MSELTIAPELALKLQEAAKEAGYTTHDLYALAHESVLTKILPALIGQGTVVEQCHLKPFTRITYEDQNASVEDTAGHLHTRGVTVTDWAKALLEEDAYFTQLEPGESYDLYQLTGSDLGLWGTHKYPRWVYETRAAALGLELGPPILALYALLCHQNFSCCHVASEPFSNDGYTAHYLYISSSRELHTELDVFDNEVARSALLTQEKIFGVHQWLFFKRVA